MNDAESWSGAEYVALGSSFASGPGVGTRVAGTPRQAARSQSNYAHQLAAELGLRLRDVTSSGATSADLLSERQYEQPPQADAVGPATRLVTITAGGNDVGYVQALLAAGLFRRLGGIRAFARRIEQALDPSGLDERLSLVEGRLAEVAVQIRKRAPQARIVFVDYLTLLPADPENYRLQISLEHARLIRSVAERLETATAQAAASTGSELVRASTASREHHAWSAGPWTNGLLVWPPFRKQGVPFHPNPAGIQAVARLLAEHLR